MSRDFREPVVVETVLPQYNFEEGRYVCSAIKLNSGRDLFEHVFLFAHLICCCGKVERGRRVEREWEGEIRK